MIGSTVKSISKFLSLVLRHHPEKIGLELDEHGWADVTELIEKSRGYCTFSFYDLLEVVNTNDKQRFSFNVEKTKIRANQGHSIDIDLALSPIEPPEYLYHGTTTRSISSIMRGGISKVSRNHVHLSIDKETATKVGSRHGIPVILTIRAGQMHRDGILFYRSENGVWLTEHVEKKYISR